MKLKLISDHTTHNLQLQQIGNAINYISTHLNKKRKRDITVFINVERYQRGNQEP